MLPVTSSNPQSDPVKEWFARRDWLQGWSIPPNPTVDIKSFSKRYYKSPDLWSKAFRFLSGADLLKIKAGDYKLEGDDLVVKVQEYLTREEDNTMYEAHRKYADIQYMIVGSEKMGVVPLENTAEIIPYDNLNDIIFLRAQKDDYHIATPDNFFIFLPENAHRPCVKNITSLPVKKIVIKVRIG